MLQLEICVFVEQHISSISYPAYGEKDRYWKMSDVVEELRVDAAQMNAWSDMIGDESWAGE